MRRELAGSIALDTSALLELVYSTRAGLALKEALLEERVLGHVAEYNLIELEYVLCRRLGWEEAARRVNALASSGYVVVHETSRLASTVALLKCKHAIAVGDCFTLAVAKRIRGPALFARREEELARELQRGTLGVRVLFLEELV